MTTFQWLKARGYESEVALWVHSKNERALLNLIEKTDSHTLNEYLREVHPEKISEGLSDYGIRSIMYDDMGIVSDLAELRYKHDKGYVQAYKGLIAFAVILMVALVGVLAFVIITFINNMKMM